MEIKLKLEKAGCTTLRTATLVLGWVSLVQRILLAIVVTGTFLLKGGAILTMWELQFVGLLFLTIIFAFEIGVATSLLYGVYKKRPAFMIPFLGELLLPLGPIVASVIAAFAIIPIEPYAIVGIVVGSICTVIILYLVCVVWSYYENLRVEVGASNAHTFELQKTKNHLSQA